jgi:UDP-N-acetylmuramoyl-tripeptide--D-alanyl-D-alanine ligase
LTTLRLRDVLDSTVAVLAAGIAEGKGVTGVSTDTRTLVPGALFVALSGPNFDGNRFAQQALESGAGALLLRDDAFARALRPEQHVPMLVHPEPRRALADLAGWYRSTLRAPVIGITG